MLRVLFCVLALVAAVLALVLNQPLLYVVAGPLLVIALIMVVTALRRRHREAQKPYVATSAPLPPEAELKSLGIMEIRPKEENSELSVDPELMDELDTLEEELPSLPSLSIETPDEAPSSRPSFEKARPITRSSVQENGAAHLEIETHPELEEETTSPVAEDPLVSLLQALQATIDADTVCLLKQEDAPPEYQVVALFSQNGDAPTASFLASTPLLTASMAQQPMVVRHVGEGGIPEDALGYRVDTAGIQQVAMAPIPRSPEAETYFLLADTQQNDHLSQPRSRSLLIQFARLLGTILNTAELPTTPTSLRPRREIIAEEMEEARSHDQPLTMALVYLNEAEAIADEGEAAVSIAERLFETRLRELSSEGRIERFGELTYGVFHDGQMLEVETWADQVQSAFAIAMAPLDGGVSIGMAVLSDRHVTPDEFRTDATAALREAYESGTCTILD